LKVAAFPCVQKIVLEQARSYLDFGLRLRKTGWVNAERTAQVIANGLLAGAQQHEVHWEDQPEEFARVVWDLTDALIAERARRDVIKSDGAQ
jgi:hypothetical protein